MSRILPSMNEVYYNLQNHYYYRDHLYEYANAGISFACHSPRIEMLRLNELP